VFFVWFLKTALLSSLGSSNGRRDVAQTDRQTGCVMLVWMIRVMKETVVRQHEWQ
jgi:hypothetical protein